MNFAPAPGFRVALRLFDTATRSRFGGPRALAGAQNAVAAGGRYGRSGGGHRRGRHTGDRFFALGVRPDACWPVTPRAVFAAPADGVDVFVVDVTGGTAALMVCDRLRRAGMAVDRSYGGRSMKAQMKVADRSGASFAVIIGEDELAAGVLTLRDMVDGSQYRVEAPRLVGELIRKRRR